MAATGEAKIGPERLQFDRSMKLSFRASAIGSDVVSLRHRERKDAARFTEPAARPLADPRTDGNGRRRLAGLPRQSVF